MASGRARWASRISAEHLTLTWPRQPCHRRIGRSARSLWAGRSAARKDSQSGGGPRALTASNSNANSTLHSPTCRLRSVECALELLTASARGPPPDWLSFLAGLRPAHNDRADRPIPRWQGCRGKVKCSADIFLLAHPALPDALHPLHRRRPVLLRPPRNLNAYSRSSWRSTRLSRLLLCPGQNGSRIPHCPKRRGGGSV